jgi:hypothetical protein
MPTSSEALIRQQKQRTQKKLTLNKRQSRTRKRICHFSLEKIIAAVQPETQILSGTTIIDDSETFDWLNDFPYWHVATSQRFLQQRDKFNSWLLKEDPVMHSFIQMNERQFHVVKDKIVGMMTLTQL